ncbi:hypothetical protein GCM10022393_41260 [Aquimarina addita]|uniref:JmjC domain-containing protein n=1 Tax=Aquimarina addita TaxID=870485 RepID=A0ABP6UWT6_9FLAO
MNTTLEKKEGISGFQDLIHPYSLADFSTHYWDKKSLLIKREDTCYFESLLTISNIDEVLDLNRPKGSSIRVVKYQEPLDKTKYENADGSLNLNQIYAAYVDGYTIVVNEIDRFWKPLKIFCHTTRDFLNHKTVANMYLTPKNQKGLLPHYDTHDVFVIQVSGTKHWKLYDVAYPTPMVNSFQPIFQREQLKNVKEITLNAGDMMYIPRGIPHEAITTDESSLHLTIGVYPTQWIDLLTKSLHHIAYTNVALRQALPIGFLESNPLAVHEEAQTKLQTILQEALNTKNMQGAKQLITEEFRTEQQPMGDGHFKNLDKINELNLNTRLVKRDRMNCKVQEIGAASRILFSGNVIKGPITIAPVFDFVVTRNETFQVQELPMLSDENKLKLCKRLIRGGLLKIAY